MDSAPGHPHVIAWAASLYDGEGSCSAYLPKRRRGISAQILALYGAWIV